MTKEALAMLLNGRQMGAEITQEEERIAKESGLVVIFGASDDLVEFRGAIDEEESGGADLTEYRLDSEGIIPGERDDDWSDQEMETYLRRKKSSGGLIVRALWCPPEHEEYSWFITADAAAPFDVMEGDEFFCRGIVIDLPGPAVVIP